MIMAVLLAPDNLPILDEYLDPRDPEDDQSHLKNYHEEAEAIFKFTSPNVPILLQSLKSV